jgi:esterase/lipase
MKYPILLLHAALGCKTQLEQLKNILEKEGFEVHSFNFSGHADNHSQNFGMDQFAIDINEYLDQATLKKVNIFGYSMGGYAALRFAATNSDRVFKIMTLGTKFDWSPETAAQEIKMLNPEIIQMKIPKFAEQLEKMHGNWKKLMLKTADMMLELSSGAALNEKEINALQLPIQLCLGTEDNMVGREETVKMQVQLPNASFKLFDNVKHPIDKVDMNMLAKEIQLFFEN